MIGITHHHRHPFCKLASHKHGKHIPPIGSCLLPYQPPDNIGVSESSNRTCIGIFVYDLQNVGQHPPIKLVY